MPARARVSAIISNTMPSGPESALLEGHHAIDSAIRYDIQQQTQVEQTTVSVQSTPHINPSRY